MSLNDAANLTKKAIAYFVLFLVLYMIGENLIKGSNYLYNKAFPYPGNPPTIAFGKIEIIDIPSLPIDLSEVEYRKELTTSGFPSVTSTARVYEIEQPRVSVAKEEKFKGIATELGFNQFAIKVSDSERLWVDAKNRREFRADMFFETFQLETKPEYLESTIKTGNSPSKGDATEAVRNFFATTQVNLDQAEYTVTGVKIIEGIKKQTPLPTQEKLKYVNVVPKIASHQVYNYGKKGNVETTSVYANIYNQNPEISNIHAFVALSDRNAYV